MHLHSEHWMRMGICRQGTTLRWSAFVHSIVPETDAAAVRAAEN